MDPLQHTEFQKALNKIPLKINSEMYRKNESSLNNTTKEIPNLSTFFNVNRKCFEDGQLKGTVAREFVLN